METGSLPTLPAVVTRLLEIVDEDTVSYKQIAEEVNSDPVIASRVLKIVNSCFYGFPAHISTVSHALTLLGLNMIKSLVLSSAITDLMNSSMTGLWDHSWGTALASSRIAERTGTINPDEALAAGLLHDLGKVVIGARLPKIHRASVEYQKQRFTSSYAAEKEIMGGVSHTDVGNWIARESNLPASLREAMAYHHTPARARRNPGLVMCVHLADAICHGLDFGSTGARNIPDLDLNALKVLGFHWRDLGTIIDEVDQIYEETDFVRLMDPEPPGWNDGAENGDG